MAHESLALLSYSIAFDHPVTGEHIDVEIPERFRPAWALPAGA
jgi:hypothetical protein